MSENGEEIINRLPATSGLRDSSNPAYNVIDNTIGAWMDNHEDTDWFSQFFLQEATGDYLDLHGKTFNIRRKIDESDDDYRKRIIYESMGHLTVDFLLTVYDVELYGYEDNFSVNDNMLISDNPYQSRNGFLADADTVVKDILNKKFVIGSGVTWL